MIWIGIYFILNSVVYAQVDYLRTMASKYKIESNILYLDKNKFTLPALKQYFAAYLNREVFEELSVRVTCDQDLIDRITTSKPQVILSGSEHPIEHYRITGPHACLYKIGENVFFEYRDTENRMGWEVLRGENILSRSFGISKAHFVGQRWTRHAGDMPYRWTRCLILVVPTIDRMSVSGIRKILKYYDRTLEYPINMDITILQSFNQTEAIKDISLPSLETINYDPQKIPMGKGRRVYYFRDEGRPSIRVLNIYNGGKSIYSELLTYPDKKLSAF
jgi:hypothetical protein